MIMKMILNQKKRKVIFPKDISDSDSNRKSYKKKKEWIIKR